LKDQLDSRGNTHRAVVPAEIASEYLPRYWTDLGYKGQRMGDDGTVYYQYEKIPTNEAMLGDHSVHRIIDSAFVGLVAALAVNFMSSEYAWYTHLLKLDPVLTKFVTAFVFYFFGDNYAQRLFSAEKTLDWKRLGGSTLIGGILGIIVYFEYWTLNTQLPPMLDYVLAKSVIHTVFFGSLNNIYFVGAKLWLFEGKPDGKKVFKRVKELFLAGAVLRFFIHLVGFGVISMDYQMLWVNFWMAIFTVINTAASHGDAACGSGETP
jgi:hypothetical protein